jgi:hypothetical protein
MREMNCFNIVKKLPKRKCYNLLRVSFQSSLWTIRAYIFTEPPAAFHPRGRIAGPRGEHDNRGAANWAYDERRRRPTPDARSAD